MKHLILSLCILISYNTYSQTLVKDFNTSSSARSSSPGGMVKSGPYLYFSADDGTSGRELWRTDGTLSGTVMIRDINPGDRSSSPDFLTDVNGVLFFQASTQTRGRELWKSDGTAAGTVMVKDIHPGFTVNANTPVGEGSDPEMLISVNGALFFKARNGDGEELWKSDGTEAGTVIVKDIFPGGDAALGEFTLMGNKLYFSATDGVNGLELWSSDGTASGTQMVKDIRPGSSSAPSDLIVESGVLYFTANNGINGVELWRSDGTDAGTYLVADIHPASSANIGNIASTGTGSIYFTANDGTSGVELWKSDGTAPGTYMVKDIYAGSSSSNPQSMIFHNNMLYLDADEGTNGRELWRSDGTAAGTVLIKDIYPGTSASSPRFFIIAGGELFFRAVNIGTNTELWKTDGTDAGTQMVTEIRSGSTGSNPSGFTVFNNILFLSAENNTTGIELWKSDGTASGTSLVKNILTDNASALYDGLNIPIPNDWVNSNGKMFFGVRNSLQVTNGTLAGTTTLKSFVSGLGLVVPQKLVNAGGIVYAAFNGNNAGTELWRTDGTPGGTSLVKDISTGSSDPDFIINVNGLIYFAASDANGREIWKSDGTEAGTVLIKDIRAGSQSSNPQALVNLNGIVLFVAETPLDGRELWRTDGTDAGTFMVMQIRSGSTGAFPTSGFELIKFGNYVYFNASNGSHGAELWRSDGTLGGAEMVYDLNPGTLSSSPDKFTISNNKLFFTANNSSVPMEQKRELYVYDGGTPYLVKSIFPSHESNPQFLTDVNGTLYFLAFTSDNGLELWRSDGTLNGTVMVHDLVPGKDDGAEAALGPGAQYLAASNGYLYYSAFTPQNGFELWRLNNSDPSGSAELLGDVFPGTQSSSPINLTNINGSIYFIADNGTTGKELFIYDPSVNYILPQLPGSYSINADIAKVNNFIIPQTNQLVATILQTGSNPLNHEVNTKVTVDAAVQQYNGKPYVQRHYDIEPATEPAISTARVTLYFGQSEFDNFNAHTASVTDNLPAFPSDVAGKSALRVTQFHGVGTLPGNYTGATEIINPDDNNIVWNNAKGWWEVSFDVTGFSGFYITSEESVVVPVTLVSFTGLKMPDNSHLLKWKVEQQVNIDSYTLQRKGTNGVFTEIIKIPASSGSDFQYAYSDEFPLPGSNFYRLLINDYNAGLRYSNIVMLENNNLPEIRFYPNPVKDELFINIPDANFVSKTAILLNAEGKYVRSIYLKSGIQKLNMADLASGIYFLKYMNTTQKIVRE